MSNTKFTPGPWDVYVGDDESIRIVTDERRICDVTIYLDEVDGANAHLIAAAPDMYEALKALRALVGTTEADWQSLYEYSKKLADAAIAKAEGKEP